MPIIDPKAPKSGLPSRIKAKSHLTPLTPYETRFVSEFIIDLNKTIPISPVRQPSTPLTTSAVR
jgi:hypothetical protein